jgi:hypothetical protein
LAINHLLYQPKLAFPYLIAGRLSGQLDHVPTLARSVRDVVLD